VIKSWLCSHKMYSQLH